MAKKKPRKKPKLSPEQRHARRIHRKFSSDITATFEHSGFTRVKSRGLEFALDSRRGEFDHVFVYNGIVVLLEETCTRDGEAIKNHLNNKANFASVLHARTAELVALLDSRLPGFKAARDPKIDSGDCKVIYVYCSRYPFEKAEREEYRHLKFLSHEYLRYFRQLTKTIGASARYELFKFLGLTTKDVRSKPGKDLAEYRGFVLPERPSGFPVNHKLVTFYIDPATLIEICYALRRDSWQDADALYQRMLIRSKIRQMRKFLATKGHVYINNVIVSLPQQTGFVDGGGKAVEVEGLSEAVDVTVRIPREFNSVGLIDGQHRVFSYHEGSDEFESKIAKLRDKQQLLVTGIIFPPSLKPEQRLIREADLFLEINDRQSRTKSELKQSIETIIAPYSDIAMARSIISELARSGPLTGHLKDHYFDEGQIKISSIVSYALRYLVTLNPQAAGSSLIDYWTPAKVKELRESETAPQDLRIEYIKWCAGQINQFISAFKTIVPKPLWTTERKTSRALSVTMINGLIFGFRDVLLRDGLGNFDAYCRALAKLDLSYGPKQFTYKSSHYRALGGYIYERCFNKR